MGFNIPYACSCIHQEQRESFMDSFLNLAARILMSEIFIIPGIGAACRCWCATAPARRASTARPIERGRIVPTSMR
jgi:hypothetical protein